MAFVDYFKSYIEHTLELGLKCKIIMDKCCNETMLLSVLCTKQLEECMLGSLIQSKQLTLTEKALLQSIH